MGRAAEQHNRVRISQTTTTVMMAVAAVVIFFASCITASCWAFLNPNYCSLILLNGRGIMLHSASRPSGRDALSRQPFPSQTKTFILRPPGGGSSVALPLDASTSSSSPFSSSPSPPPPLPETDDPFVLLGLDPPNNSDPASAAAAAPEVIKRAYRRRATTYHPDVVSTPNSTPDERQRASKDFARINAAYEALITGGGGGGGGGKSASPSSSASSGGRSSGKSTSSYDGGRYDTPEPHRSRPPWSYDDHVPNYDNEDAKYDEARADLFGDLFSDFFRGDDGATEMGAYGGRNAAYKRHDLIDFIERNAQSFESSDDRLLRCGTYDEVAYEMDRTDALVIALERKLEGIAINDLGDAKADLAAAGVGTLMSERLETEEGLLADRVANLAEVYLERGRSRLFRLRERYWKFIWEGRATTIGGK